MADVESGEEEYYKEETRVHVHTTWSGRMVYSVSHLILPLPGDENEKDLKELELFDAENGSSCEDGLSTCSLDESSSSEEEEGEEMEEEEEESGSEF